MRLPLLQPVAVAAAVVAGLPGCAAPRIAVVPRPSASTAAATPSATTDLHAQQAFARLEQRYGARLGVAAIDTGSGRVLQHRAGERFAFASTNKAFIAAAVLRRSTEAQLDQVVRYSRRDLLAYAPVTAPHVGTGMTVRALIDAALRFSDNTAANLLVERAGGADAVQAFLRGLGDATTSVDRVEPDLNSAVPGDRRDTTTPAAFARDLQQVLLGAALPADRRALLASTMRRSTTGDADIRAGVPDGWTVADKTGSGAYGTRNDIAVITPPDAAPIVLVLLSDRGAADAESRDALLAQATEVVVDALGGG